MKRLGNIYHKIYDIENLRLAHKMASRDKGYYKEVIDFNSDIENNLLIIHNLLKNKTYQITNKDYKFKLLKDKGKERELMKLRYSPHRIIQWAIMLQCESTFMEVMCNHTCASLKDRGTKKAHNLVTKYLKYNKQETEYCLKLDIKKFYPNIDKNILKELIRLKFKDKDLLWLFYLIIDSYPRDKGLPIGSYLSQYFANYYLTFFDHYCKEKLKLKYIVRYMDDIVILHNDKKFLHKIRKIIASYLKNKLKLAIKDDWQVFPVKSRGIDFVGFVFRHSHIRLRRKNSLSLRRTFNKIKRKSMNYSLFCSINSRVGFFQYFNHIGLYKKYIEPLYDIFRSYYRNYILTQKMSKKKKARKTCKYMNNLYDKKNLILYKPLK